MNVYRSEVADFCTDDDLARCERIAEALCLLNLTRELLEDRRIAVDVAVHELGEALDRATRARDELDRASDLTLEAARLVALVKGVRV